MWIEIYLRPLHRERKGSSLITGSHSPLATPLKAGSPREGYLLMEGHHRACSKLSKPYDGGVAYFIRVSRIHPGAIQTGQQFTRGTSSALLQPLCGECQLLLKRCSSSLEPGRKTTCRCVCCGATKHWRRRCALRYRGQALVTGGCTSRRCATTEPVSWMFACKSYAVLWT